VTSSVNSTGGMVRLPVWAIALMMLAGLLSVMFAGGTFFTFVALGLLAVNIVGAVKYFGDEMKRLRTAHIGTGTLDKTALRKDAMGALPTPKWMVVTLVLGSLWTGLVLVKFAGILFGLIFSVAILALVGVAAYYGYKFAKDRGYIS